MSAVSASTALVPYNPNVPHVRSYIKAADLSARNQLEARRLDSVLPPLTGRNIVHHSSLFFTPPAHLNTDLFIGTEIYRPESDEKKPMLVFSHGMGVDPVQYRHLLKELASHGVVVLSITHPSGVEDLPLPLKEERARSNELGFTMANNIRYILDQIQNGALQGIADVDRILLAGHSIGGAASINVARTDPKVAGAVNLDGFLHGDAKIDGLKQPLLLIIGDYEDFINGLKQNSEEEQREFADHMGRSLKEYDALIHQSLNAKKIMIPRGSHMDFTDAPFHSVLAGEKSRDVAMQVHHFVSQTMLQFIQKV